MTEDIELGLLRTRVEATARWAREAQIKAKERGQLLERLLKTVNGPAYHYISIQLTPRQEVADILVDNESRILDLFLAPPSQWADLATGSDWKATPPHRAPATQGPIGADASNPHQPDHVDAAPGAPMVAPKRQPSPAPSKEEETDAEATETAPCAPARPTDAAVSAEEIAEDKPLMAILGGGAFLIPSVIAQVSALWPEMPEKTRRRKVYEGISRLAKAGLVEKESLGLAVSTALLPGVGRETLRLTEQGVALYRRLFGSDPVDALAPFAAKYKTVEAGLLIRRTKEVIEEWNQRDDRRWTCEVIDAVWEPDEALARIPGAQRSYAAPDGSVTALPDLIVQMRPESGRPLLAVVEVERGAYHTLDLRQKWERAIHCYPPMMIYVLAPNRRTQRRLWEEWKATLTSVRQRDGLAHDTCAAFYTLLELTETGLLTGRQLTGLLCRKKAAREKREPLPPQYALRLPRFWCAPKTKPPKGEQLELV